MGGIQAERFIAVDNVCAWPNLTHLPDGTTIVATIFNQPTHGGWEGDVECWASTDGGRTWTPEERNWWEPEKRAAGAAVVDRTTGEIFMFNQGTWPLQDDQGRPLSESWIIAKYQLGRQMGARLTMERSSDEGRTWTAVDFTDEFYTYPEGGLAWFIGHGIQLRLVQEASLLGDPSESGLLQARSVVGELENHFRARVVGGELKSPGRRLAQTTADGRALESVVDRVAHQMEQRIDQLVDAWNVV